MSFYRQQLEDWLAELDVKADTVLDIGGKQLPVKGRTKSWDVKEYKILDLPDYNLETDGNLGQPFADIIFCLEVFEYLINPLTAMRNIKLLLKRGGLAYITFPQVYPIHEETTHDSLRYTEAGICRLAEAAGLTVTDGWVKRHDKSGLLQQFYAADGMHPAKGWDHSVTGYIVEFTK